MMAAGGGLGGIVVVALVLLLGGTLTGGGGGSSGGSGLDELLGRSIGGGENASENSEIQQECRTGADANEREECRIVGFVNSIQAYWTDVFAEQGERYQPADTIFFSGSVDTACGSATSSVGPFYCPADQLIYIDLGFFDDLETRFGASGGPLAEAYVLAHEYGHHVQDLLGVLRSSGGGAGAESDAGRVELQADCFAGAWAGNAVDTGYLEPLRESQVADALSAAEAVGDDRIQEATQGSVNPETWTHGSSAQRQEWFSTGYDTADPGECDTFAADI